MINFLVGSYVQHLSHPHWGYGRIVSYSFNDDACEIFWLKAKDKTHHYKHRLKFISLENPNELLKEVL